MAEDVAAEIIRQQEELAGQRGVWENLWRIVARRVLPRADEFGTKKTPGTRRDEWQFDSTAALALERFAAAMQSLLTPSNTRWHSLKTGNETLDDDQEVRRYLEAVRDVLFKMRYAASANFASQINEVYMSEGAFGTGVMFIDDIVGRTVRYKSIHLGEVYIAENEHGKVDTVYRRFELTARQAAEKWGRTGRLPSKIMADAEKAPFQKYEFIHCVRPNFDRKFGRVDFRGMEFSSCYVAIDGKALLSEGGYRSFPYAVPRYVTGPRETYGRGPAITVLADIQSLNEMTKTILRAAQKEVDPPLLLHDDGVLQAFQTRPGALNYGMMTADGRALAMPLKTGANIPLGVDMQEPLRKSINDAFLVTLFQILVETPNMTATEALIRAQEKGALLAPTMGRQQSELLGPIIERELDIAAHAGLLPPMPEQLRDAGGIVDVEYESPMSRMMRAEEGVGLLRTFEQVTPALQAKPELLDYFNFEEALPDLADINGMPAKWIRTKEEIAAIREGQEEMQAASMALEAAPVAADAARSLAEVQAKTGVPVF